MFCYVNKQIKKVYSSNGYYIKDVYFKSNLCGRKSSLVLINEFLEIVVETFEVEVLLL